MTIDEKLASDLLKDIKAIDAEIEASQNRKKELLKEWVVKVCPMKVGDLIPCCGHSHRGKTGRVTSIHARQDYRGKYLWLVYVVVLKKDSKDSAFTTDISQLHWEMYLERTQKNKSST
jgi:hypothetical protein